MTRSSGLDGLLLIDKDRGWTSHDVVARVRRITGQRRAGHTGTLDPMATGLLVVCLGQATRLVEYMTGHDKRYEGEITLGVTTDTDDAEGTILERAEVLALDPDQLSSVAKGFLGTISQLPPAYSAVKVQGKRAYAVARAGGSPEIPSRRVDIRSLTLAPLAPDRLRIDVHCGSGTYVRSLARDIGTALGCGGHLSALRRTRAGPFDIRDAVTLPALDALQAEARLEEALMLIDEGVLDVPAAILARDRARDLALGKRLAPAASFRESPLARVYDAGGGFVAMATVGGDGVVTPLKVFTSP